jgi:hypothetical protein
VRLPIFPCWADECPPAGGAFAAGTRVAVEIALPADLQVRLTDDRGRTVARGSRGSLRHTLIFEVQPSYRFEHGAMPFPAGAGAERRRSGGARDHGSASRHGRRSFDAAAFAQRPLYFLELWPRRASHVGRDLSVSIDLSLLAPGEPTPTAPPLASTTPTPLPSATQMASGTATRTATASLTATATTRATAAATNTPAATPSAPATPVTVAPTPTVAATATPIGMRRGDANCDERNSAADLPALLSLIAAAAPSSCAADADGDGDVDAGDVAGTIAALFTAPP